MISVTNEQEMKRLGERFGTQLRGGEVIELIGDVGAGKTTLTKGVGAGLQVEDDVQSPSFTISRVYKGRDNLELHHYDFYRLHDAGVMKYELAESIGNPEVVTIIEWAETVRGVLPRDAVRITINYTPDGEGRTIDLAVNESLDYLKVNA